MTKFTLLRLDFIAMVEVLKLMNPISLFNLSQISQKSIKYAQLANTKNFKLSIFEDRITVNQSYHFEIAKSLNLNFLAPWGFRKFQNVKVEAAHRDPAVLTCVWKDGPAGILKTMLHLIEVFGCTVESYEYCRRDTTDHGILTAIMEKQGGIRRLSVLLKAGMDTEWINENVKGVEEMICEDYCRADVAMCANLKYLYCMYIDLNHMLALKSCEAIIYSLAFFNLNYVDSVMKAWKSGDLPNLQYFSVRSAHFIGGEVLGFTAEQLSNKDYVVDKWKMVQGRFVSIYHGVEIQRDDGARAVMGLHTTMRGTLRQFIFYSL